MHKYLAIIAMLFCFGVQGQISQSVNGQLFENGEQEPKKEREHKSLRNVRKRDSIAPIKDYKIISINNDTIVVDTALSINKFYTYNYLRKDNFGLLAFNNVGQTYNTLKFNPHIKELFPDFGFRGKQFGYMQIEDIKYYHVPTPYTDLYYKSVMKQGQNLDAFITMNTSENFNFSIGYKGLRSVGRYINELSSTGNFRFGSSYQSPNKKYLLRAHFTAQDFTNGQNGGIVDLDLFKTSEKPYNKRERLNVYFRDVETVLKGNRVFLNHQYQLNNSFANGLLLTHEFVYESKFFEFNQADINSAYDDTYRFGNAFQSTINNKTRYNKFFNKIGAAFNSAEFGRVEVFADFHHHKYHYKSITHIGQSIIPDNLQRDITLFGGKYAYKKNNLKAYAMISGSLTNDKTSSLQVGVTYNFMENWSVDASFNRVNRLGDLSFYLFQSDYVSYNWNNDFKNEKLTGLEATLKTPYFILTGMYQRLDDKLYFSNDNPIYNEFGIAQQLITTPKQYDKSIDYLSFQIAKDLKFGKFGLDNTILYQNVKQADYIVNVPAFTTRNTLYYTDAFFDKALKFQTGISFKYFSKYKANDYNPLLGSFFVQDRVEIGDYPVFDFFIDMKIRTAKIFLILEHFNSSFTGYNYYSAPNYPYRDFTLRFGISWNFFT
ncbi:putative porin [Myroides sp. LJL119]